MGLSALLSMSGDEWTKLANWTPVYAAIEKRWCAIHSADALGNPLAYPPPSGTAVPAAYDLRTKSPGYDLQTDGARWFTELQRAVDSLESLTLPYAGTYVRSGYGWLDPSTPWTSPNGFLLLDSDAAGGFAGRWRRKRPREIATTTATADVYGNAAVAGQRAYKWPGGQLGPDYYASYGPRYRCVAPGNWVRDDSQVPDLLDSNAGTLPFGLHSQGDYIAPHLFSELYYRITAMKKSLQMPYKITASHEGQGTSNRQELVPPYDDPEATATAYPPTLSEADTLYQADYHVDDFAFAGGTGPTNAPQWTAQGSSRHGLDEFGNDGYSVGGFRNIRNVVMRASIAGAAEAVLVDTGATEGTPGGVFDAQGSGLAAGGLASVGGASFGALGATDQVIVEHHASESTPPTYPTPPSTGDGLYPWESPTYAAKGYVGRVWLVITWDFGSE